MWGDMILWGNFHIYYIKIFTKEIIVMKINKLDELKEQLKRLRTQRDFLLFTEPESKDIEVINKKISELENEIEQLKGNSGDEEENEGNEGRDDEVAVKYTLPEKIDITERNSILIKKEIGRISEKMKEICEQLDSAVGDESVSLKNKLLDLDQEKKSLEKKLSDNDVLISQLKKLDKCIKEYEEKLNAIEEEISDKFADYLYKVKLGEKEEVIRLCEEGNKLSNEKKKYETLLEEVNKEADEIEVKPEFDTYNREATHESSSFNFKKIFEKYGRLIIAVAIMLVMVIAIVFTMGVVNNSPNPKQQVISSTTAHVTKSTVKVTKPTTTAATEQPTTKVVTKSEQSNMGSNNDEPANGKGGGYGQSYEESEYHNNYSSSNNSNYDTHEKDKDMSSDKDSNKDEGIIGGNEGYDANISSDKESPSPEKKFEEDHTLPPTISQEEINQYPTVALTPRTAAADNQTE